MNTATQMKVRMDGSDQTAAAFNSIAAKADELNSRMSNLFQAPHINLLHLSRGMTTAFSVGGIIMGIKGAVEEFDKMAESASKASDKMGVTLEQYEAWVTVAGRLGMNFGKVEETLEKLQGHGFSPAEINALLGIPSVSSVEGTKASDISNTMTRKASGGIGFGEAMERWANAFSTLIDTGSGSDALRALSGGKTNESIEREIKNKALEEKVDNAIAGKDFVGQNEAAAAHWKKLNGEVADRQAKEGDKWKEMISEREEKAVGKFDRGEFLRDQKQKEQAYDLEKRMQEEKAKTMSLRAPWQSAGGYGMVQAMYGAHSEGTETNHLLSRMVNQLETLEAI